MRTSREGYRMSSERRDVWHWPHAYRAYASKENWTCHTPLWIWLPKCIQMT